VSLVEVAGIAYALFALLVSPIVVMCYGLYRVWQFGRIYVTTFARVLGVPDATTAAPAAGPPRHHTSDGREPAYEQYLFGQAGRDLGLALSRVITRMRPDVAGAAARIMRSEAIGPVIAETLGGKLLGVAFLCGLLVGTVTGALFVAAIAATQIVIALCLIGLGLLAIQALRGVDSGLLRVRGIRMTCPKCYRRISYPSYRCPGCGAWHHDVRPGRYGVLRRRCGCGDQSMPTLLILGSYRMTAFCPYEGCEVKLAKDSGTAAEFMLPIFGGPNVGKTRLMTIIVMNLADNAAGQGITVEFADEATVRRYSELSPAITRGEPTRQTVQELPRAYSLYITPAAGPRRIVHLFDAPGEKFCDSDKLEMLQYHKEAGTYLFVIDPLSIERVWAALPSARREALKPLRGNRSPVYVLEQLILTVRGMGVDLKRTRLAVAVSKADVLAGERANVPEEGSSAIERWLDDMDLDHMVRSMRHTFREVRFFRTTAMLTSGGIPASITELTDWLLAEWATAEPALAESARPIPETR
jgi:Double-GTPase 2